MFTTWQRDSTVHRLIDGARADPAVTALALLGPAAAGTMDEVGEVDMMVAAADPDRLARQWTDLMYREFDAVHHAPAGGARTFVLPDLLMVNVTFVGTAAFGPRGTEPFRPMFGTVVEWVSGDPVGTALRSVIRARAALIRGAHPDAAAHLTRLHRALIELASRRLAVPAERLPYEVTVGLAETVPTTVTVPVVEAAYRAAAIALDYELQAAGPTIGDAVTLPLMEELAAGS